MGTGNVILYTKIGENWSKETMKMKKELREKNLFYKIEELTSDRIKNGLYPPYLATDIGTFCDVSIFLEELNKKTKEI